jgi:hypothetical protein
VTANGPHQLTDTTRRPTFLQGRVAADTLPPEDADADACPAFGYLRAARERALALELRFRGGDSEWLPYSHLAGWRYNPSVGLLLKYTTDLVTLVLIRGSNLDAPVGTGAVNLTDQGLQRHRVLWVREMDEAELRSVGDRGPTIDAIEVAEFESHADLRVWLATHASVFSR